MPVLGKMALAVAAGGVALGTMLGAAANPVMKKPVEQPWLEALRAPVAEEPAYLLVEAPPQDLSPYRDSYAPTWAREELVDWEPEYPEWTYSELVEEPHIDEQPVQADPEVTAPPQASPEPVELVTPAREPPLPANLAGLY